MLSIKTDKVVLLFILLLRKSYGDNLLMTGISIVGWHIGPRWSEILVIVLKRENKELRKNNKFIKKHNNEINFDNCSIQLNV